MEPCRRSTSNLRYIATGFERASLFHQGYGGVRSAPQPEPERSAAGAGGAGMTRDIRFRRAEGEAAVVVGGETVEVSCRGQISLNLVCPIIVVCGGK